MSIFANQMLYQSHPDLMIKDMVLYIFMRRCSHCTGSLFAPPSVSLHFLGEKPDGRQSGFWRRPGKRRRKAEGKKSFHSQPYNALFMKPHVLLLFKAFSSTESSILSHCEAIIWGAISTEAKIVLFVKYWLSKMGPTGLDGKGERDSTNVLILLLD